MNNYMKGSSSTEFI